MIGTGRVGLPLALTLLERGAEVRGVDRDARLRHALNVERKMPFLEPGFDELAASGRLRIEAELSAVADAEYFVITVGTPLMPHLETDLSAVTAVIVELAPLLRPGQTVLLRSTTAPRTTEYVRRLLEAHGAPRVGEGLGLACCPERIAEGHAREELCVLPQVVGSEDEASARSAERFFRALGVEVLHCDYVTAELVKLTNNASRYAYFAISNALALIAMEYGAEPYEVLRLANQGYPRPVQGRPGFTAGTCLRKDFGLLSESSSSRELLLDAWRINESMPRALVEAAQRRWGSLHGRRVTVLGYTFKRDTDDTRDTLSAKLLRYVLRECPSEMVVHDPFLTAADLEPLPGQRFEGDLERAVEGAQVLFLATNHSTYTRHRAVVLEAIRQRDLFVVDLWNALETGHVLLDKPLLTGAKA